MKASDPAAVQSFKQHMAEAADGFYYEDIDAFIEAALPPSTPIVSKNKREYINIPASFDIETTSFYQDGQKAATMYIWMFSAFGCVIVGRSWTSFLRLLRRLQEHLTLDTETRRMIVYVENLGFEFQFMKNYFSWPEIFAMEMRRPVKAVTDGGIEFRCAQYLSGNSLAGIGKNLTMFPVAKLSGDLDYSLMRNADTELTDTEMQYCINDVLVLQSYIYEKILTDGSITRIPLTKTGYVRKLCRNNCLYVKENHKTYESGKKFQRYRSLMKHLVIDIDEYKEAKRAYQGGFTHGNAYYTDQIIDAPIKSLDFTSSYPYCLIAFKYPMSAGERYDPVSLDDFYKQINIYWCMFDIAFEGLEAIFHYDHYISRSKCLDIRGETVDNGRVVCASYLMTACVSEDFKIISMTYKWKHITIYNFRRYRKAYLPTDFVKTVVDLYKKKTVLKGVAGSEREYMLNKENLNSLYGMCVTDICRPEIKYNEKWYMEEADVYKSIEQYNTSKQRFVSYLWGIACTAFARFNLWRAILACKNDYIYADTDSIKVLNYPLHKSYFDRYNEEVIYLLRLACNFHQIPLADVMPKTQKGVEKIIGVWDDDGDYVRMKFLGAKRYLTESADGELHLTVAGVHKTNAAKYLKMKYKTNLKVFAAFTDDLLIPAEITLDENGNIIDPRKIPKNAKMTLFHPSGKNTHTYVDDAIDGYLKDYQGHVTPFHEESFVHLESAEYNLSLASEYVDFIKHLQSIYL